MQLCFPQVGAIVGWVNVSETITNVHTVSLFLSLNGTRTNGCLEEGNIVDEKSRWVERGFKPDSPF